MHDLNSIPPPSCPKQRIPRYHAPDRTARPSKSRRLRSQTTIQMYFSPINPNGHTTNAPNIHHRPTTTNNAQQPTSPPTPSPNCSPAPSPQPTQRRKPTTNILQYILHRSTATLTSPDPINTPTTHNRPHNQLPIATITSPNMNRPSTNNNATQPRHHMTPAQPTDMNNTPDTTCSTRNSTPPTNESHSHHHTPTTHIPSDNTETFNQQHSVTDQRPNLHSLPTNVNDKKPPSPT